MNALKYLVFYTLLSTFAFSAGAQPCNRVLISGKVSDTLLLPGFYNLMVANRTSGRGVFGQPDGSFSVYASDRDSITLSVQGYPMYGFRIQADSNCQMKVMAYISGNRGQLDEFVVHPLKTLQEIKEERASLSMREVRTVTGLEVIQSPITALYQRFSQREQSRQWVSQMEYKDDQRKVLKELLRLYVAYDIVKLDEQEFDDFIEFLNIDENFLKTASDMELITFIQDKFEHFSRMNKHYFEDPEDR